MASGLVETDSLMKIIDGGIASLTIDGRVLVRVPGPADTLDLRVGSSVSRNGTKMVLSKLTVSRGQATLVFKTSSVPAQFDLGYPFSMNGEEVEFALLNASRHEAVALQSQGGGGASGGWLVLPGVQVSSGEHTLENQVLPRQPDFPDARIPDEWFNGARLVISHWVPVGSYPIHAENVHPTQPVRR
jgi:hypothetical protein